MSRSDVSFNINICLNLTEDELTQFYWNLYGTSLVEIKHAKKAKEGYSQLIKQIESFFIEKDPDNLFKLQEIKNKISKSLSIKGKLN